MRRVQASALRHANAGKPRGYSAGRGRGINLSKLLGSDPSSNPSTEQDKGAAAPASAGRGRGGAGRGRGGMGAGTPHPRAGFEAMRQDLPPPDSPASGRFADAEDDDRMPPSRGRGMGFRSLGASADFPLRGHGKPLDPSQPRGRLPFERAGSMAKAAGRGEKLRGTFDRLSVTVGDDPLSEELLARYNDEGETLRFEKKSASPRSARGRFSGRGTPGTEVPELSDDQAVFTKRGTNDAAMSAGKYPRRTRSRHGPSQEEDGSNASRNMKRRQAEDGLEVDDFPDVQTVRNRDDDKEGPKTEQEMISNLYGLVMMNATRLPVLLKKPTGIAKFIAEEKGEDPRAREIPAGFAGIRPGFFEPPDSRPRPGFYKPAVVDTRLAVHEEHAAVFAPHPKLYDNLEDWYAKLGVDETSPVRDNVRLRRALVELCEEKYEPERKKLLAKKLAAEYNKGLKWDPEYAARWPKSRKADAGASA